MKRAFLILTIVTIILVSFNINASTCVIGPDGEECDPPISDPTPVNQNGKCKCGPLGCDPDSGGCIITLDDCDSNNGYIPRCQGSTISCYLCPYVQFKDCINDLNNDPDDCWDLGEQSSCLTGKACSTSECKCKLSKCADGKDNDGDDLVDEEDPSCYGNQGNYNNNIDDENRCGKEDQKCCYGTTECNPTLNCVGDKCKLGDGGVLEGFANGELCDSDVQCESKNCVPVYNKYGNEASERARCCPSGDDYFDRPFAVSGNDDPAACSNFGEYENICNKPGTKQESCDSSGLYVDGYSRCCNQGEVWSTDAPLGCVKEQAIEDCKNPGDDDGNGESDYDKSDGLHGDMVCPVEVKSITILDQYPEEQTTFEVECQTSIPSINSISAFVDYSAGCTDCKCSFVEWFADKAKFSCNSLNPGTKTVMCTIQDGDYGLADKSYQTGTDKTQTITVESSTQCGELPESGCNSNSNCDWCPTCQQPKYNQIGSDQCVTKGTCSYICKKDQCGATWDEDVGGCPSNVCTDETHIRIYEGSPELCICDDSTSSVIQCTGLTCEQAYPGLHLTGTCVSDCISNECGTCTPTYTSNPSTSDCNCEAGWTDADSDPDNGCEALCNPTSSTDCCGDSTDNDCDGEVDNNCDNDGDGYIDSYIWSYRPERLCPGIQ